MVFLFLVIMRVVSNVLVVIQSPTYWLDIYVARMMRLGFAFGAFLDPVADELMVASTLILLCTKPMDAVVLGTSPWLVTIPSITIISYTSCQSRHSYIGCNQARKRSRSNRREKIWCSTKLDLMDKGTNALEVLEGRSYMLQHPWVGIVNRSQADINKNVNMMLARCKEREYFDTSTDYGHLAIKMGSEYLTKLLLKHLESVIRSRIPSILSLINKSIEELEKELDRLGRPVAVDARAQLYTILEMCRAFDKIFKDHLDGGRPGGDRIYGVFDNQLPVALKKLPFDRHLSLQSVKRMYLKQMVINLT